MFVNVGLGRFGVAKQSAKGVPAGAPEYIIGLKGGAVGSADPDDVELNQTWDTPGLADMDRQSVVTGADITAVAMPLSTPRFLQLALGAASYAGGKHTIRPSFPLPYCSLFGEFGGAEENRTLVSDAKVDSFEISFDKTGAAEIKVKFIGCDIDFSTTWTEDGESGGAEPVLEQSSSGKWKGSGGVFKLNGTSVRVVSGNIKIENAAEAFVDASGPTPSEVAEKNQTISGSLTVVPEDLALYRKVITGSDSGASPSGDVVYGELQMRLMCGAYYLNFSIPHAQYSTKTPELNPSGGPVELPVEMKAVRPTDGSDTIVVEVTNSRVTSY